MDGAAQEISTGGLNSAHTCRQGRKSTHLFQLTTRTSIRLKYFVTSMPSRKYRSNRYDCNIQFFGTPMREYNKSSMLKFIRFQGATTLKPYYPKTQGRHPPKHSNNFVFIQFHDYQNYEGHRAHRKNITVKKGKTSLFPQSVIVLTLTASWTGFLRNSVMSFSSTVDPSSMAVYASCSRM